MSQLLYDIDDNIKSDSFYNVSYNIISDTNEVFHLNTALTPYNRFFFLKKNVNFKILKAWNFIRKARISFCVRDLMKKNSLLRTLPTEVYENFNYTFTFWIRCPMLTPTSPTINLSNNDRNNSTIRRIVAQQEDGCRRLLNNNKRKGKTWQERGRFDFVAGTDTNFDN